MATPTTASDVKSTAVVKYSSVKMPVQFSTIRLNTDLNHPPSDQPTYFSDGHGPACHSFSQFLSVNLAHTYQDLVGQVDVISSSKNIKALLKMPYSKSPEISIMVHRLCKTLLLEEFDVFKHLIRKQEEEWNWLRKYFLEVIAKDDFGKQSKCLDGPAISRDADMNNMYMNLIRHSFAASENGFCTVMTGPVEGRESYIDPFKDSSQDLKGYHHETLWNFQDISMLIDSDLPIFGGGGTRRPCISLRLRDARSPPINILTGLDYWLDNLMSNVPEVAMCYHMNGVVQKYEVMKTEDIPNLENSAFDPNEVLDIAQNIMSFIKRNAAVEGHTYWLYKSENDDMVKLYDLTDLCKKGVIAEQNPFTVPVGLLCHRVGANLKASGQRRNADSKAMFENCVRLLDDSTFSEECADAHFHLSDMWVPDKSVNDIWQEKGKISEPPSDLYDEKGSDSDENSEGEMNPVTEGGSEKEQADSPFKSSDNVEYEKQYSSTEKEAKNAVALKELVVRGMVKSKAWHFVHPNPIAGSTDERCRAALAHIRKGLNCTDKDLLREKHSQPENFTEPKMRSPSRVIPLPYQPLNIGKKDQTAHSTNSKGNSTKDPSHVHPSAFNKQSNSLSCESGQSCNQGNEDACSSNSAPVPSPDQNSAWTALRTVLPKLDSEPVLMDGFGLSSESVKTEEDTGSSSVPFSQSFNHKKGPNEECVKESWHHQAKYQLLRKAAITYFVLAKEFFEIKKYGHTLRHLRYAVHCYEALGSFDGQMSTSRKQEVECELYLMLLYLAAQARSCLYSTKSACRSTHNDFEELGEEEAAILHSAQAILPVPKMAWIYEWSHNQEDNLVTALNLFVIAMNLPVLDKKSKSFRSTMKKDHAACIMNLGHVQMEICKDLILRQKEPLKKSKPMLDKAMENFKRAIQLFNSLNERNLAANNCSNAAFIYTLTAAAIHNHAAPNEILPREEQENLLKAIEWSEKCAKSYERVEKMDAARERAYHNIRVHYQQMAAQFFVKKESDVTEEDLLTMREYLHKSLKYCFLDGEDSFTTASRVMAANNHLNLAKVSELEACRLKNSNRRKHIVAKIDEHFKKSVDLFKLLKMWRSMICATVVWVSSLLKDLDSSMNLTVGAKKRVCRNILLSLCEVKVAMEAFRAGDIASEDKAELYTTNEKASEAVLGCLNNTLKAILKMDQNNQKVKALFKRSLRVKSEDDSGKMYTVFAELLEDLKSTVASGEINL